MKVALQGRAQGAQQSLYEEAGIEIKEGRCSSEDELIELIGDADGAQVGIMPLTSRPRDGILPEAKSGKSLRCWS